MTLYIISYDLTQPDRDYSGLYGAIEGFNTWWHYLESTWIVKTTDSPDEIFEKLKPYVDENDNLLIVGVGKKHQGWLPKKAWDWINRNQ